MKVTNKILDCILARYSELVGVPIKEGTFPGPQPVAVEKRHLPVLKNNEYVVCEKSDGERKLLLILYINEKPMCFLVDRNNEYKFIELSFKKTLVNL